MGSVRNTAIKTLGRELIRRYGDRFTDDFEQNKRILEEISKINSKTVRNILVGYITREMKKMKAG